MMRFRGECNRAYLVHIRIGCESACLERNIVGKLHIGDDPVRQDVVPAYITR